MRQPGIFAEAQSALRLLTMPTTHMRRIVSALLVAAATWLWPAAVAAKYPERPVNLIVAFTPGGPSDVLARILGKKLEQLLGQPFVIENRPGAGGNIAAELAARAAPDGYTLLMGNNSILATNASLYKTIGYDAEKDFAPISLIGSQANILVVNPALAGAHDGRADCARESKARPARLCLLGLWRCRASRPANCSRRRRSLDIVHVAYKGAAPALQDVIAGHVQMMFATAASVVGHVKDGLVRPLAVTTPARTAVLPDIPTVAELGLPGFEATTWHGLVAPAGTPQAVIETLHRATVTALNDPAVRKALGDLGVDIAGSSPAEFSATIKAEIPKWRAVVQAAGGRLD